MRTLQARDYRRGGRVLAGYLRVNLSIKSLVVAIFSRVRRVSVRISVLASRHQPESLSVERRVSSGNRNWSGMRGPSWRLPLGEGPAEYGRLRKGGASLAPMADNSHLTPVSPVWAAPRDRSRGCRSV